MSEEKLPKRIAIIGGGMNARLMKIVLEQKLPGSEIQIIEAKDMPVNRKPASEPVMMILDELLSEEDEARQIKRAMGRMVRHPECERDVEREIYSERRYQKPPRLHGAAQQKRQAKKAKNKGKRK